MFRRSASVFCAVILCVLTAGCAVNNTIDEQEKPDAAYEKANTSEAANSSVGSTEIYSGISSAIDDVLPDKGLVFDEEKIMTDEYLNRPMFLAQPEGSAAEIYLMRSDSDWESDGGIMSDEYVIIRQDGIDDIIPAVWTGRSGGAFTVYAGDYDGDGEQELAAVRYAEGGTFCMIMELAIYKRVDGHYHRYGFDNDLIMDEIVQWNYDKADHNLSVSAAGFDRIFSVDTAEMSESGEVSISGGQAVRFTVDGCKIKLDAGLHIVPKGQKIPADTITLSMEIHFSGGEFSWSEPGFTLGWE